MVLPFLRIGLRENAEKELKAIEEKGLNTNNVDNAYKLVEIVKGIDKINMMQDSGEYSRDGYSRDILLPPVW